MKRFLALLLMLALLVPALPVQAETWYVYTKNGKTLNLRDEVTNKVIGNIPYGTALEPDGSKSTETAAYVTYKGQSGFVKWEFLQRQKPKSRSRATPTPQPDASGVRYQGSGEDTAYQTKTGGYEITALGAYIQFADSGNKGAGEKWETLRISEKDNIVITADVPRGKKIDYWVINGVRYDFCDPVKSIRLTKADANFQFEVVYTKSDSGTLISPQAIQDARTGETLLIKTVNAQLCHIKGKNYGAGGWLTSFEFTEDYTNRASGEWEQGGQVTAKVNAKIPKNQRVRGWKFNETELYPNLTIPHFIVRTLNASMTYEPIFTQKTAQKTPPKEPDPKEPNPPAQRETYYTVTCKGCTFSGGGYSGATTGKVKAGTKITVKTSYSGGVSRWTVNGSVLTVSVRHKIGMKYVTVKEESTKDSFTRTVNQNTTIVCTMKIN